MRLMLLMKSGPNTEAGKHPDPAIFKAMDAYNDELKKAGAWVGAEGLKPSKHGVRLFQCDGERGRIDGPFAEAKEVVAGFWIVDLPSVADAVEWVKKMPFEAGGPAEARGEVEIRPFWEFPGQEPGGAAPPAPAGLHAYMSWVGADEVSERGEFPEGSEKLFEEMGNLMGSLQAEGRFGAGDGLRPTKDGAKVVFTPGKREVIDGPFTETKELVAGFAVLYAKDLEDAVELGWRFLAVDAPGRGGKAWCEIRPMYEATDFA